MTNTLVIRSADPKTLDDVRDALQSAFVAVRDAVGAGQPVTILVTAGDLHGQRSIHGAAYANALVGIARATAFEGARAGWKVNIVAVPDGTEPDEDAAITAVEELGLSGQIVSLGTDLVGKVIP